jgi:hypothetical protein
MTFKITVADQGLISTHVLNLRMTRHALIKTIEDFNYRLEKMFDEVQSVLIRHNEEKESASALLADLHRTHQESFDEKSEEWKNSIRGVKVQSWIDELELLSESLGYETQICVPTEIDIDIENDSETLNDIYSEPEDE